MADFDSIRAALASARDDARTAEAALADAHDAAERLQAELDAASRRQRRGDDTDKLTERVRRARANEAAERERLAAARALAIDRLGAFEAFSDPRDAIEELPDEIPILLFPVRLETRFKSVVGDDNGSHDELWVRIYPDTCAVDTFEEKLSDTEVANARRFWIETWAAGGIEAQARAAWRNLVASHGAGRAAWIVHEFAPAAAPPAKATPDDIVLVIATEAPPSAQEQAALSAYWEAVWLAEGDRVRTESAAQTLAAAPGVGDAQQLIELFVPANLAASPVLPTKRDEVGLDVAWLVVPDAPDSKTRSWTAPARLPVMPDRFVVLGYQDDRVVFEALGNAIPSPLSAGPNPSAPPEQQFAHDAAGNLHVPDELRWMVDFEEAVGVGMGLKVPLDSAQVDLGRPLQRVVALGLRLADTGAEASARLEELLAHHRYGSAGLSFVPQGTPTNNTDSEAPAAGYDRLDDPDAAYDALFTDSVKLVGAPTDWWERRDGQWLADALGIGAEPFDSVPHAADMDLAEARAMNRALWPATFGYAMETMLHPVFDADQVDATRWFQTHFVSGRGLLPSLRIGNQPYGVLPVSALSRWEWLDNDRVYAVGGLELPGDFIAYRQALAVVLNAMRVDWAEFAQAVSSVGDPGDPHQLLLDVIGLHPASVEFHQRYAESLEHLFNRSKLQGLAAQVVDTARGNDLQRQALALLRRLGYAGELEPDALSRFFFARANRLNGPLIDDRPLSEQTRIRAYTADGRNYLEWLVDTARGSFEDLRQERGFKDDRTPQALLYVLLHHALLLGYWDSSLRLHLEAGVLSAEAVAAERRESPFVHVAAETGAGSESRYRPLYSTDVRVAGSDGIAAEHLRTQLDAPSTERLADQLAAVDLLKDVPTARLERCLAEHLDTAAFRLDAWLLGLVNYQLAAMRYRPRRAGAQRGTYLGAYGWLEDLQPKTAPLEQVELDAELDAIFNADGEPPLLRDPANGGYIPAPSLNQATTAAILRAGYLANASPENPGALAVNLSSGRVRTALGLIEGIRNGQPLGALLGYRLQRGLHEGHPGLELDRFAYPLRKQFPLVADQMASTKTGEDVPIETIEANNVIDGLKLIEHVAKPGRRGYPFGLSLPSATTDERAAIDGEVDALLAAHDALADLALAEGVHQAVLGNYDRVAATLDAFAKGAFPPEPEVVRTPRSGVSVTHRVGLHFGAGADPTVSPVAGIPMTPRARAQAMVNRWLRDVLPDPDDVGCRVEWFDPVADTVSSAIVTQTDLALQPIDLLYVLTLDSDAALGELEDRILRHVVDTYGPRPDATVTMLLTERLPSPQICFFEVAPLVRHLRSLLLRSRPLTPTDLTLSGEATAEHDATQVIARNRVERVRVQLDTLRQDIESATVAAPVDAAMADTIALFERAARFGIDQVGWGFMYLWKRRVYSDLLERVQAVVGGWNDRLARFKSGLDAYDLLPGATSAEERFRALGQLDLLVATVPIAPRPATPLQYRNALPGRRDTLAAKRDDLEDLLATTETDVAQLLTDVEALLPLSAFEFTAFTVDDVKETLDAFTAELAGRVDALETEVKRRLDAADDLLKAHDASADPTVRVSALKAAGSALFGEDVQLIPEFSFAAAQAAELSNALTESTSGRLTEYVRTSSKSDFPVDDWLHGVARAREKLHAWEQANLLATALGAAECDLVPMQLPHRGGEDWLALEFDPASVIDGEHLLYTAHYAGGFAPAAATCGLLLDEWTEVIPAHDETAGLSFHYDRPGSEPPQTWLLVTPARMQGRWQWADLVGALEETLALARLRGVEPVQVDDTAYARFLPATTTAVTLYGISIAANYSTVNHVLARLPGGSDG